MNTSKAMQIIVNPSMFDKLRPFPDFELLNSRSVVNNRTTNKFGKPMFDAFRPFPDFELLNSRNVVNNRTKSDKEEKLKKTVKKGVMERRADRLVEVIISYGVNPQKVFVGNGEKVKYRDKCLSDDKDGLFLLKRRKEKHKPVQTSTVEKVWEYAVKTKRIKVSDSRRKK